ncbi:hypothetical protein [Peribacillus simplex]|uniref:hypothetical protein n=1 Tax=Peribacillus simplex TaxID=1478 RepID=UPI003D2B58ED
MGGFDYAMKGGDEKFGSRYIVWMLYSTMKTNKEREANYQAVIEENQDVIETQAFTTLSHDVKEIKEKLLYRIIKTKMIIRSEFK